MRHSDTPGRSSPRRAAASRINDFAIKIGTVNGTGAVVTYRYDGNGNAAFNLGMRHAF